MLREGEGEWEGEDTFKVGGGKYGLRDRGRDGEVFNLRHAILHYPKLLVIFLTTYSKNCQALEEWYGWNFVKAQNSLYRV